MRIRIYAVGRAKQDPISPLVAEYLRRVERSFKTELVEIREESGKSQSDELVRERESERLLAALGSGGHSIAFDPRGTVLNSETWAAKLGAWRDRGVGELSLLIGGANGLTERVRTTTNECWSLSALTLPHRIARLVVAEQLYRAASILRGEPYHR